MEDCQTAAKEAGKTILQYASVSSSCYWDFSNCDAPITGTGWDWVIYKGISLKVVIFEKHHFSIKNTDSVENKRYFCQ